LTDILLYRVDDEISHICNALDTDTFLRDGDRKELVRRLEKLVEDRDKIRVAINVHRTNNTTADR